MHITHNKYVYNSAFSTQACITEYHRPGDLNNIHLFIRVLEPETWGASMVGFW